MPSKLIAVAVLVVLLALASLVLFLAYYKGRDSSSYRLVSALVAPISRSLHREVPSGVSVPYSSPRGQLGPEWKWLHREQVGLEPRSDSFSMYAATESVWFLNAQGPLVYRHLDGDGTISASVKVRKRSAPNETPDMEWQFAGLLVRDPAGDAWMSLENYVFNVVGFCCGELQVETKSTHEGLSDVHSFRWDSGDAELSIQRSGSRFTLRARHDAAEAWRELISFERPDLPPRLQVGLIVYALSFGARRFDLQASFDQIAIH